MGSQQISMQIRTNSRGRRFPQAAVCTCRGKLEKCFWGRVWLISTFALGEPCCKLFGAEPGLPPGVLGSLARAAVNEAGIPAIESLAQKAAAEKKDVRRVEQREKGRWFLDGIAKSQLRCLPPGSFPLIRPGDRCDGSAESIRTDRRRGNIASSKRLPANRRRIRATRWSPESRCRGRITGRPGSSRELQA